MKNWLLFCLVFFRLTVVHGQKFEMGFLSGYGYAYNANNLPEGNYQPHYGILHLAKSFQAKSDVLPLSNFKLRCFVQPQVNSVTLSGVQGSTQHIEFGLSLGAQIQYLMFKGVGPYIELAAGPHFFDVQSVRQARGFIFSDLFGLGLRWKWNARFESQIGYRIRHLSNAELLSPNQGVNTHNWLGGVFYCF